MKKHLFITVLLFFVVVVIGCSGKRDVTGIWKGKLDGTNKGLASGQVTNITDTIELMLAQSDKNISGKITLANVSNPVSFTIKSGIIVDKAISLEADELKIDAVVNGNSIDGKFSFYYGGMLEERRQITASFQAKKI